jgi:hypothetical protein
MMMPVPATAYVLKRKRSMWELARSVFKFGTGESNDNTVDDIPHLSGAHNLKKGSHNHAIDS